MRRVLLLGLALAAVLALTIYWIGPSRTTDPTPASGLSRPAGTPLADATVNGTAAASTPESGPTRVGASTAAAKGESEASATVASARGRFIDKSGAPVEGVKIHRTLDTKGIHYHDIERLPDPTSDTAVSDADGRFRWVEPVRAETTVGHRVWREAVGLKRGYARVPLYMELVFGRETPLGDFLLEPGGDISGVVRDPEGRAFEGAVVKLVEAGTFPSGPLDPFSPHPWVKSLRGAHSGVDGKFTMAGAPVGSLRLFANHDKLGYAVTEAFLLKAGEYLDTFVLTLRTLPPEATVEGRVVDPTGDGVGATIEFSYRAGGSSIQTANDGTFRWRCAAAGPYTILATDLGKKFGGARLTGVNAGTRDLRLLLTEPRDFVVEIVNDAGEAVGEGAVNLVQKEGMRSLDLTVRPFNPPGRALLRVPPSPFSVEVRSPGHVTAGTATIDPANAPQQLRIVLRRLPTIEGRVVSHGKPVKGVWVAFQAAASGRDYGFTFRHHFDPMGTTPAVETGPDGTFSIAPSEPVKFAFLRASPYRMSPHENKRNSLDLAAAELGPFEYDGRTPVKGLEIVMTSGGGIAGTLRLPVGRSPAGQIIGASNGDGDPANTKTRDDGSFEFVQLTPGRYDVKWMDGVDFGNSTSITPPAQVPSVPWNCVVEDGAVTPFDLDYSSGTDPFLLLEVKLGRLALGGAKARGETSGSAGTAEASEAVLDAEGRGRVKLPKGGSVRVTVSHSTHGGVQYEIHSTVAVDGHGETRHTLDIPTGILRGTAPAIAGDDVKLTFSKIGAPPYATTTIVVKPGVPFEINPAPAGPTHVKLPDGKSVQVAVPAGGAVEVKWP